MEHYVPGNVSITSPQEVITETEIPEPEPHPEETVDTLKQPHSGILKPESTPDPKLYTSSNPSSHDSGEYTASIVPSNTPSHDPELD